MIYIILGGGLQIDGSLPSYVFNRVDYCIQNSCEKDFLIFSSRYSLNTPPKINKHGFPLSEAKQMLELYRSNGGISENLYLENASSDTIGSAFFTRILFEWLINNKELCIVTSDFHINRVKLIFTKILIGLQPKLRLGAINFIGLETKLASEARKDHEEQQLLGFKEEYGQFTNLGELSQYIFTWHGNYSPKFQSEKILSSKLHY